MIKKTLYTLLCVLTTVLFLSQFDVLADNGIKVLYEEGILPTKNIPTKQLTPLNNTRKTKINYSATNPEDMYYLCKVIVKTLNSNPNIIKHLKSLLAAGYAIRSAKGAYFPKLDLKGRFGRERIRNINTDFEDRYLTPAGGSLILTQNLFAGFHTVNEVSRNKYRTLAEKYLLEGAANEVALLTSKAYLDVLRTNKIINMAKNNYYSHLRTYNMIKQRSETGIGRKVDTAQAYGRLALAKANVLAAQNNYKNSLATFKKITGFSTYAAQLKLPCDPANNVLPLNAKIAEQEALMNHPVLKAANYDIEEALAQHRSSKAPNYPRIDLVGEATHGHDIRGLEKTYNNYSAYLQLNYNLFAGGRDIYRQAETSELVGKARAIRDNTCRQVRENMQLAWNSYETTTEQLKYFRRHKNAAATAVGAYREQFKLGKRTLLDLLDSEDELFNARVDDLNGKISSLLAKYRVLSAENKLLSYFGINLFSS